MKILVWNASARPLGYTTGVGKHVVQMVSMLAGDPHNDVRFVVPNDEWEQDQRDQRHSPIGDVATIRLPIGRRMAAAAWLAIGKPEIDRYFEDADWVYCPRELYAPCKHAKLAVTVHDLYRFEHKLVADYQRATSWQTLAWKRALCAASAVLCVSNFTAERLQQLFGVSPSRIAVVGNGVEAGFFSIANEDPQSVSPFPNESYILAVGGFTRKKGAGPLLRLAGGLARSAPHIKVVVVGPIESEFEAPALSLTNLRLLQRGFPTGFMERLVRGAACSVNLSDYEGFGIPVAEAMAAGVPVVVARRSALPEVIGDAGAIVDPDSPGDVLDAVMSVLNDRNEAERLVKSGHRRAALMRWEKVAARLVRALDQASQGQPLNSGDNACSDFPSDAG